MVDCDLRVKDIVSGTGLSRVRVSNIINQKVKEESLSYKKVMAFVFDAQKILEEKTRCQEDRTN